MNGIDFFKKMLRMFFIIVTLINAVVFLLGSIFMPEAAFGYEAYLYPLLYAACSLLPFAVMYSNHELSIKELLIRKVIQFILIELILYLIVFGIEGIKQVSAAVLVSFGFSILAVFILAHFFGWLLDVKEAKQLTEDLKNFQERQAD